MKVFAHEVPYVANIVNMAIKEEMEGTLSICKIDRLWVVGYTADKSAGHELVIKNDMIHVMERISKFAIEQQRVELKYGEQQYLG